MANKAAWLTAAQVMPFKVDDAPMPVPEADKAVIRNRAVAINPVDWAMQAMGIGIIVQTYPFIGGFDPAGEITAVGSAVKDFKIGDRVVAIFDASGSQNVSNAAFQLFSSAGENSIAQLPDNVSYAEASVLPLGHLNGSQCTLPNRHSGSAAPAGKPKADGQSCTRLGWQFQRRGLRDPACCRRRL
jgi:NADPH:quinone reductase-like Zn-dependent oxidoreductase